MIFTQPIFAVFLALVFLTYWALKNNEQRLSLLLVASAVFYGWWNIWLLGLIGFVILVSWFTAGQAAALEPGSKVRRRWLTAGIVANLGVLAVFKYFNFFRDSGEEMIRALGFAPDWPTVNILLPVGISFYVFQAISYIVDTARGHMSAEPRLRRVALYIAFFPQLVAGPIVRAASFFPQMEHRKTLTGGLIAAGARAFILGFVYKAGLADNLAPLVDPIYGNASVVGDTDLSVWSNLALIGATIAFAGQIYFDFAGYSLMAIGVARWFGFFIPKNFDYPYSAVSIQDFWRRWHISLSSWLRDYLYIPLGGNRLGKWLTYRNLMITMLLGGLWHGAAWTFVAWGLMHGLALAVHRYVFGNTGKWLGAVLSIAATQLFVLLTWAAFRAEDFGDMTEVWMAFTGLRAGGSAQLPWVVWLVPALLALDAVLGRTDWKQLGRAPILRRPAVYWGGLGALTAIVLALYPLKGGSLRLLPILGRT